jgi:hypothetical protein
MAEEKKEPKAADALKLFKVLIGEDYEAFRREYQEDTPAYEVLLDTIKFPNDPTRTWLKKALRAEKWFKVAATEGPPTKKIKNSHQIKLVVPAACDTSGQFVTISHLQAAGLGHLDTRRLFVRTEWSVFWTLLQGIQNILLTGPPGTGKSSLVWAWCCWRAGKGDTVRWIHISASQNVHVVDISSGTIKYSLFLRDDCKDEITSTTAPILVIDGLTKDATELLGYGIHWWQSGQSRRLIFVSSNQFRLPGQELLQYNLKEEFSQGWKEEEYTKACKDATLLQMVRENLDADDTTNDIDEMITAKFFIAGASARWMFFFNTELAIQDARKYMAAPSNLDNLASGFIGERSNDAVNHLITQVDQKNILVSQFVARELSKKTTPEFLRRATVYAMTAGNPSFDGWIFQMDFLHRLQHAISKKEKLELTLGTKKQYWDTVPPLVEFFAEKDLDKANLHYVDGIWLLPTKINQPCYDVLQLFSANVKKTRKDKNGKNRKRLVTVIALRVVQITVADTHSLKMKYVVSLLKKLEEIGIQVEHLEVAFVVPNGNGKSFKPGDVSGVEDEDEILLGLEWDEKQIQVFEFPRLGL